ncbi:MAG: DUF2975 domain-containing protein [Thermodesulfobacteriota bacterium]
MDNMLRIRRMSGKLLALSTLMFWVTPILCAAYWFYFNDLPAEARVQRGIAGLPVLSGQSRLLCFVATMLPAGVGMAGFRIMRRLFGLYAEGEIFSGRNVSCYRSLGRVLLCWAGAVFLHTPLLSLAASLGMPEGQRYITVGIGSIELMALFAGAAALVISWVMDEGRGIEEDRALTI